MGIPRATSKESDRCYIFIAGYAKMYVEKEKYSVCEGDVVYVKKGKRHALEGDATYYGINNPLYQKKRKD